MDNVVVVIPVVQGKRVLSLIKDMEGNTILPGRVIIIDNTESGIDPVSILPITRVRPPQRLGVNASWTLGMKLSGKCDAISVLNDDICIGPYFFQQVLEVLGQKAICGVVCPQTARTLEGFKKFKDREQPVIAEIMVRREGWAYTMRKSLADRIPPIPDELKTFCGDDWYWYWTQQLGFLWFKSMTTAIFHYIGLSVREMDVRDTLEDEKEWFRNWVAKHKEGKEGKDGKEGMGSTIKTSSSS